MLNVVAREALEQREPQADLVEEAIVPDGAR
jgi:hypothetical protein